MNLNISLLLDESPFPCILQLKEEKYDISLLFFDDQKSIIAQDKLSDFSTLVIGEDKEDLIITLKKDLVDRVIKFPSQSEWEEFFDFMNRFTVLTPSKAQPKVFRISVKPKAKGILGLLGDVIEAIAPSPDHPTIRQVDAYTHGTVVKEIPDDAIVLNKIISENFELSKIRYSLVIFEKESLIPLFNRLLLKKNDVEAKEDYQKIRTQWKLITRNEWECYAELRIYVHSVEKWIQTLTNSENFKVLIFGLAMSLFSYFFGDIQYSTMLEIEIFTLAHVYIEDQFEDGVFTTKSDEKVTIEEAEQLVFWPLVELHKQVKTWSVNMKQDSIKIRSILGYISPSTLQMLNDRKIEGLDFTLHDAQMLFLHTSDPLVCARMIASMIADEDAPLQRQAMTAASLCLLQERLQLVPLGETIQFTDKYKHSVASISPMLLLYNAEKILGKFP